MTRLGRRIDLLAEMHGRTKRNYLERVLKYDKARLSDTASQYGAEYWDGDRSVGFGGYRYDGRWAPVARDLAKLYELNADSRVLDVGCGKGYLLYELMQIVPGITVRGLDVSVYAVEHAKEEVRESLVVGSAAELPFDTGEFSLAISMTVLDNLHVGDLWSALRELERVSKSSKYVTVQSWRNSREKVNLLLWQVAMNSFYSVEDWEWMYRSAGYSGDYGFVFYE